MRTYKATLDGKKVELGVLPMNDAREIVEAGNWDDQTGFQELCRWFIGSGRKLKMHTRNLTFAQLMTAAWRAC